jgi:hypothetical protein
MKFGGILKLALQCPITPETYQKERYELSYIKLD